MRLFLVLIILLFLGTLPGKAFAQNECDRLLALYNKGNSLVLYTFKSEHDNSKTIQLTQWLQQETREIYIANKCDPNKLAKSFLDMVSDFNSNVSQPEE